MTSQIKHRQVLHDLILDVKPKRFAEMGVWKSHLTKYLLKSKCASIIEEYWAIDQWRVLGPEHGRMSRLTVADWRSLYFYCCRLMIYFPQLKVVKSTTMEAVSLFENQYFDMVFVDANHFYDRVKADILAWMPKIKRGGFITGHDYNMGRRKKHNVKQAVDDVFGMGNIEVRENGVWIKEL